MKALDGLGELRASADSGKASPLQVTEAYNALISASNRQFGNSSALTDVSFYRVLHGLTAYATSAEFLYREHAVLTAVLARGEMTSAERTAFVAAMTSRRIYMTSAERDVGPDLLAHYRELVGSAVYQRLPGGRGQDLRLGRHRSDSGGRHPVEAGRRERPRHPRPGRSSGTCSAPWRRETTSSPRCSGRSRWFWGWACSSSSCRSWSPTGSDAP